MYADLGWREPPGINHFDDLIVMATGLAGLVVITIFRSEVVRLPSFAGLFSSGLLLFASAIAWDAAIDPTKTYSWWTEETLELAGALLMTTAFRWRWVEIQLLNTGVLQASEPAPPMADAAAEVR